MAHPKLRGGFGHNDLLLPIVLGLLALGCVVIALGATLKLPDETSWLASLGYFLLVSVGGFIVHLLALFVIAAVIVGGALAYEFLRDRIRGKI
ncbi:hypothetical protein [Blastopirellula marina]|uniref:Uncharacterized protein n=1 Tax=Blastopirellula marina TaxID=124 RepID=A0A2S8GUP6_9BACT|nr:hypothetical protein [Blastopirellula marina]PQO48143.1 hypothetical protein C5Y93_00230 [Blastopirellula marina]